MRRAAVLAVALLAGCGLRPGFEDGADIPSRNPAMVLAGTTRFDADRFAGDWQTRACIGVCSPVVSFRVSQAGAVIKTDASGSRTYVIESPGVLRSAEGGEALVVMWVDDGFRTAAVGGSGGQAAAIIDRAPTGGADRISAAREILDFNGWDVSRLREVEG